MSGIWKDEVFWYCPDQYPSLFAQLDELQPDDQQDYMNHIMPQVHLPSSSTSPFPLQNFSEAFFILNQELDTSSNTSEVQQAAKIVRNKKPAQNKPGRPSKDQVYRQKIKEKEQLKDKQLAYKDNQLAYKDKQITYMEGRIFQLTSENERLRNELASINYNNMLPML